jgi:hypothetical protein
MEAKDEQQQQRWRQQLLFCVVFLRNITIGYFNKGSGMDNCPYCLHIL